MNKQDIKMILMSMRNGKNDAIINGVLGKIDLMNEEVLKKLVEEKGGTPEAIMAYFAAKISRQQEIEEQQRAIEEEQRKIQEQQRQAEQERTDRELREKQAKDVTYDLDMNRKLAQLTKGLRQKSEKEMNNEYLTLGTKFFEGIPQDKLPEVLEYLKQELGFEFRGNEHGNVEQEGREISEETITEETITKEKLEKGEIKISITKDKLQSREFRKILEDKGQELDEKAAEVEQNREQNKKQNTEREEKPDDGYDDR